MNTNKNQMYRPLQSHEQVQGGDLLFDGTPVTAGINEVAGDRQIKRPLPAAEWDKATQALMHKGDIASVATNYMNLWPHLSADAVMLAVMASRN